MKDPYEFPDADYSLLEPQPFKLGPVDAQQQDTGCKTGRQSMSHEEFCKHLDRQQYKRG